MISLPRARLAVPGEKITSTTINSLGAAINTRLRHNLGDGPWRIVFYLFGLFRQIRNPTDDGLLFPPQHEFFTTYQALSPRDGNWPVTGPGEGEGTNLSSIMGAHVFGNAALDLDSEDIRLADESAGGVPLWNGLSGPPETLDEIWELGKRQRGFFDPLNGAIGSPAFTAARSHYAIRQSMRSPHGNSYGGSMSAPVDIGGCADPSDPNLQIFFTNLNDGTVRTYPGTCPEEPTHIAGIAYTPSYYAVYLNDGTLDILLRNEWLEGPYTDAARITRQASEGLHRILNHFSSQFRGTAQQREENPREWLTFAFDHQRFDTSQYMLAPARGNYDGTYVGGEYPRFTFQPGVGNVVPSQTLADKDGGGDRHDIDSQCVLAAVFIKATELAETTQVQLLENGTVKRTFSLAPDSDFEYREIVTYERDAPRDAIQFRCLGAKFRNGTGEIAIELAELLDYKPETHDRALVLRLGSCRTTLINGVDGGGESETESKTISDNLFRYGTLINVHGEPGPAGSFDAINSNAVFEAARQFSQFVRVWPRTLLCGYEVTDGKSVLYFRRRGAFGADAFAGIAPSPDPIASGALKAERRYTVRTGQVLYAGWYYSAGEVFTAIAGSLEYESRTEDTEVYEYDGIRHTAEPGGEGNEWVVGHQFKAHHPSDSSLWKTDSYTDLIFLNERCHGFHNIYPAELRQQFDYGENVGYSPEAPTGWRYARGTNSFECSGDPTCEAARLNFYKSCRIYEPEPEIESATVLIEGGEEIVRLAFTTRFHHYDGAPSSIDRDYSTWNITDLQAEPLRTVENGIREYLNWAHTNQPCTQQGYELAGQVGNTSMDSEISFNPDNPYGTCFPDFYAVKLLPLAYEDENDSYNPTDSDFLHDVMKQAELYLRCCCEGWVDGETSVSLGCLVGNLSLYDFKYPDLCFQTFGGRWINTVASETTRFIEEEDTRPDRPQGFGPLPGTHPCAEVYNQIAACWNQLTQLRVMLPMKFEVRVADGTDNKEVDADFTPGMTCNTGGVLKGYYIGSPTDPGVGAWGAWSEEPGATAQVTASIDNFSCGSGDPNKFNLGSTRTNAEYRYTLVDPDAEYAIPEAWRDMVTDNGRVLAVFTDVQQYAGVKRVDDVNDGSGCCFPADLPCPGFWVDGVQYLQFYSYFKANTEECRILPSSGSLTPEAIGQSVFGIGRTAGGAACFGAASSTLSVAPVTGNDTAFVEFPLVDV